MSKLIKLKKWLSLEDAASYLSSIFAEPVKDYDLLRFALDRHLKLSVYLVNAVFARRVIHVDFNEIEFIELPTLDGKEKIKIPKDGMIFSDERGNCQVLRAITELDTDVWELMMYGGARLEVENLYQMKTGGPAVTAVNIDGDIVLKGSGDLGGMFMLVSHFAEIGGPVRTPHRHEDNYYPAGRLPEDAVLVVTTAALMDFIKSISELNTPQKTLSHKELESLLIIIAALAKDADIDITKVSKASELIANSSQLIGSPIGATTVERYLKKIPDALQNRAK